MQVSKSQETNGTLVSFTLTDKGVDRLHTFGEFLFLSNKRKMP